MEIGPAVTPIVNSEAQHRPTPVGGRAGGVGDASASVVPRTRKEAAPKTYLVRTQPCSSGTQGASLTAYRRPWNKLKRVEQELPVSWKPITIKRTCLQTGGNGGLGQKCSHRWVAINPIYHCVDWVLLLTRNDSLVARSSHDLHIRSGCIYQGIQ